MATVLSFERHPVHPDAADPFERLLTELLEGLRGEPGLLWADAAAAFDDRPSYVLCAEWRTVGDLDAWEGTEAYRSFCEAADPLLREAPTRRRFTSQR